MIAINKKELIDMKTSILAGIAMTMLLLALTLPAAASDYTLGVFGNANEDDTINMQDVTYTELIILEYRDETELSDAKYDGKINMQDVTQIELVILGKEKEITIVDGAGEAVTVEKPIERIVVLYKDSPEVLRTLDAADKIVGVSDYIKKWDTVWFPEISKLPSVGGFWMGSIDYEAVLSLNPDLLLAFGPTGVDEMQEKLPGVTVLFLGLYNPDLLNHEQSRYRDGVRKLGYILDKREEASEFTDWRDGLVDTIKARTEGLTEDEKLRVFNTHHNPTRPMRICCTGYKLYQMTVIAGGRDIAEGAYDCGSYTEVDTEWLIEQNPEIIIAQLYYEHTDHGYNTDDPSETASAREYIMNIPVLANAAAVKSGDVYMMAGNFRNGGDGCITGTAYMAKLLQPDLFEDLDPQAIHQEYLDRFQHFDFDVCERGVFVYPSFEES